MVDPPYRIKNMMPGMIMLWYGSEATIPSGWHLCDGTMGTPNLQNRFVLGAGLTYAVDQRGGSVTHYHFFTGDGHQHSIVEGLQIGAGVDYSSLTSIDPADGETGISSSFPSYHALCWIMKL